MNKIEVLGLIRWILDKYGHNSSLKMAQARLNQFEVQRKGKYVNIVQHTPRTPRLYNRAL